MCDDPCDMSTQVKQMTNHKYHKHKQSVAALDSVRLGAFQGFGVKESTPVDLGPQEDQNTK